MGREDFDLISREAAKAQGVSHYYTGKLCKRGHSALRQVSNYQCVECIRTYANENIDKTKAYLKGYYESNKGSFKERSRLYREKNKNYLAEYDKTRDKPPSYHAWKREYDKAWVDGNRDKVNESARRWRNKNPEKVLAQKSRRRAAKARAKVGWDLELTSFVELEAHALAKLRKEFTGISWQVDHMIPIRGAEVCGLHVWNNFQVIPRCLNNMKYNKMMFTEVGEWISAI
jgi:hypothetical protein